MRFTDLGIGSWFRSSDGSLYIKISQWGRWNIAINAINLENGWGRWFEDDEQVTKLRDPLPDPGWRRPIKEQAMPKSCYPPNSLGDTYSCADCKFTVITTIPCTCDDQCMSLICCGKPMTLVASAVSAVNPCTPSDDPGK